VYKRGNERRHEDIAVKILDAARSPKPIYGAQPVGDPVLDAAAVCVQRKGFDNTSLEEVAAEAGVSRTTLYRRYGNRDSLFTALLWARAKPFREWADCVLAGPGTVADRLETVFTHAVLEMQRVGWLDTSLRTEISQLGIRLFMDSLSRTPEEGLGRLVNITFAALDRHDDITAQEAMEWVANQMIHFASAPDWDEAALRRRVRFFVIPVLNGTGMEKPLKQRLDAIEAKLDRLAQASGAPRDDAPDTAPAIRAAR